MALACFGQRQPADWRSVRIRLRAQRLDQAHALRKQQGLQPPAALQRGLHRRHVAPAHVEALAPAPDAVREYPRGMPLAGLARPASAPGALHAHLREASPCHGAARPQGVQQNALLAVLLRLCVFHVDNIA